MDNRKTELLSFPESQPHPYASTAVDTGAENIDDIVSASSSSGRSHHSLRDLVASPLSVDENHTAFADDPLADDEAKGPWWRSGGRADPLPVQSAAVSNSAQTMIWNGSSYFSQGNPPLHTAEASPNRHISGHVRTTTPSPLPPRPLSARGNTSGSSTTAVPPPLPLPTGGFAHMPNKIIEIARPGTHPYCVDERQRSPTVPRPARAAGGATTPSPCRRAPSAASSTHSTPTPRRPPRWPSEERTMALWVDIPPSPIAPHVPTHLEQQRRRTPRGSAPPSPMTSTLVASFTSSQGDHAMRSASLKTGADGGVTTDTATPTSGTACGAYTQSSVRLDIRTSPSPPLSPSSEAAAGSGDRQRVDKPPTVKRAAAATSSTNSGTAAQAPAVPPGIPMGASASTTHKTAPEVLPVAAQHSASPKVVDDGTAEALKETLREYHESTQAEIRALREELAQLKRAHSSSGVAPPVVREEACVGDPVEEDAVSSATDSDLDESAEQMPVGGQQHQLQSEGATLERLLQAVHRARERAAQAVASSAPTKER